MLGHCIMKNRIDKVGRVIVENKRSVIAFDIMNGVMYSIRSFVFRINATITRKFNIAPPALSTAIITPPIIDSVLDIK